MLIELCLPIYNEEKILTPNVRRLYEYCFGQNFAFAWRLVLLNNGSVDATAGLGGELAREFPDKVLLENLTARGKGWAIKNYFLKSRADILVYMDIDLAVSLNNLPALIEPVAAGQCDLAFGSRLLKESRVERSFSRSLSSIFYNFLSRLILGHSHKDLQCGFKAMNQKAAQKILPRVKDNNWFFDTELVALADYYKLKVKEIPIDWSENRYDQRKSKVNLIKDGFEFLLNLIKLKIRLR